MDRKDMTLAGAFEAVAQNLKESGLTDSAFAKVADETSYIKAKLRVTPIQAFILATMLHHMDRTMQMMTFATFAQVSPVRILAMQKDFDCLAKKGYIVCMISTTYHDVDQSYALSAGIIQAVKYDKRVTSAYYKNLTSESVLPRLTSEDAAILAARYEFSGSMIENVARRLTIDEILYDRPMTLDIMRRLCDEEQIRRPIGTKKWRM